MTRQDNTTAGRTSRPAVLSNTFQTLLGSVPPGSAQDRFDQVRTLLDARDDDAALSLVAIYEVYLNQAHRWMRSATFKAIAALGAALVFIVGIFWWGMVLFNNHLLSQDQAAVNAIASAATQQTCETVYGIETIKMAQYYFHNDNQRTIVLASYKLSHDEEVRLSALPDLKERLSILSKLGPDQWRAVVNINGSDQKVTRPR